MAKNEGPPPTEGGGPRRKASRLWGRDVRQSRVPHVRSKEKKTVENFSKPSDNWQALFISCEYSLNNTEPSSGASPAGTSPRRPTSRQRTAPACMVTTARLVNK